MTTTIQTSSLTNSVTMKLLLELRRTTGTPGFGDAQRIVRETARQIVEDFLGCLLGGFFDPSLPMPTPSREKTLGDKLAAEIIRDLHRQTGNKGRVNVDDVIHRRLRGLVAAFQGDWPHRHPVTGEAVDEAGEPLAA